MIFSERDRSVQRQPPLWQLPAWVCTRSVTPHPAPSASYLCSALAFHFRIWTVAKATYQDQVRWHYSYIHNFDCLHSFMLKGIKLKVYNKLNRSIQGKKGHCQKLNHLTMILFYTFYIKSFKLYWVSWWHWFILFHSPKALQILH